MSGNVAVRELLTALSYAGDDGHHTDLRIDIMRWNLPKVIPSETEKVSGGKHDPRSRR